MGDSIGARAWKAVEQWRFSPRIGGLLMHKGRYLPVDCPLIIAR